MLTASDQPTLGSKSMIAGWTTSDLSEIAAQEEIRISSERPGGGLTRSTPIWVVRVGHDLYVRSGFGTKGAWYRHATQAQAHVRTAEADYKVGLAGESDSALIAAVDNAYRQNIRRTHHFRCC
jgi:hypothetical protein